MSSDVKIPEWAIGEADEVWTALANNEANGREAETALFARALLAAEQRGHKAGLEEAAKVAANAEMRTLNDKGGTKPIWGRGLIAADIRSLGEKT